MKGRTALITGASAGLGAQFARHLAALDCNLILVARRVARLHTLAEALNTSGRVVCIGADLAQPGALQTVAQQVSSEGLSVDVLINNAGAGGPELFAGDDWSAHGAYLQLMMLSVTEACHLFVPGMLERGYGRIVNVSSVAGRLMLGTDGHYGPAKAYLVALSEAMNVTLRSKGVHTCALCPGFTHTEFHNTPELAAMKAQTPDWLWYQSDTVVAEGLEWVERGRSVCVSGRLYRWLDPFTQWSWSRRLIQALAQRGDREATRR